MLTYKNKHTCFAYRGTECSALTEMLCVLKGKCLFGKTEQEYFEDIEKADEINKSKFRKGL